MTRQVNRAENWELTYQAFRSINFTAYNYDSIKQSMIDYVREYHSELFNDMIESSELIATIETFAYFAELMAYRYDLNAHENFITTAQRKESILRLAKYLSYSASRNIPARGLVKITSISTTESVFDSTGANLANTTIRWNDVAVSNWRERFLLVLNRALAREYGNVSPSDRVQVSDVLFEQYILNSTNTPTTFRYNATFGGETYPMEIVSAQLTPDGPVERRPTKGMPFALVFADDGRGDASELSGFFCMTKQGTLYRREVTFDGVTPNYTLTLNVDGINNTDLWLNAIDQEGYPSVDPATGLDVGLWSAVDTSTAYNVIFNDSTSDRIYEAETLDRDRVRLLFGDGEFASIPNGRFEVWYRTSEFERDIVIPRSAITDQSFTFTYPDATGQLQTLRITVSATSSLQNAASSESIERIRRTAPVTYYAQDRMVNAKDYNVFPLKDNSILKLRAIERTFAGDSKYMAWHDPTGSYSNVQHFGNDLMLYYDTRTVTNVYPSTLSVTGLVNTHIEPLLRTADFINRFEYETADSPADFRQSFTAQERQTLIRRLSEISSTAPSTVYGTVDENSNWTFSTTRPPDAQSGKTLWWLRITLLSTREWSVTHIAKTLVARSAATRFWNVEAGKTVTYDTFRANRDTLTILGANLDANGGVLGVDYPFNIETQRVFAEGESRGLPDINSVIVSPVDNTGDGVPDDLSLSSLFSADLSDDRAFIYFERSSEGEWQPIATTDGVISRYYEQFGWEYTVSASGTITKRADPSLSSITNVRVVWSYGEAPGATIKREVGRRGLNFLWLHNTPRYHLVDPATSNIIDMFVMTRGYYQAHTLWLNDRLPRRPQAPRAVELRMAYRPILANKMMSDTVVFQAGKLKTIINSKSDPNLRAKLKVIKSPSTTLTDSEIKVRVVEASREFFDLNKWEFGQTFHFTNLATAITNELEGDISSVVLVPDSSDGTFGDMFQVKAREDEIIYGFVSPRDVEIIESLDRRALRQTLR